MNSLFQYKLITLKRMKGKAVNPPHRPYAQGNCSSFFCSFFEITPSFRNQEGLRNSQSGGANINHVDSLRDYAHFHPPRKHSRNARGKFPWENWMPHLTKCLRLITLEIRPMSGRLTLLSFILSC